MAGKILSIILVAALIVTVIAGAIYANEEMNKDTLSKEWEFNESTDAYGEPNYGLIRLGNDGTIYAREQSNIALDGRHYTYFIALDQDGNLKWRFGTNAQPWLSYGPSGNIYYSDWQDISIWSNDSTKARWCNLTSIDAEGNFRWDYVADGGTIEYECSFDDGTVIATYFKSVYNATSQNMQVLNDSILAISDTGVKLWEIDRPYANMSYGTSQALANDTILFRATDVNGSYDLGISKDGSQTYLHHVTNNFIDTYHASTSGNSTAYYDVRWVPFDLNNAEISVYAVNKTDGRLLWATFLSSSDNPDHWTPDGTCKSWDVLTDKDNIIYCWDEDFLYGLDQNGTILWKTDDPGIGYAVFPSGGILVGDQTNFKRIGQDGSVTWDCDVEAYAGNFYYTPLIGPNETIISSQGDSIMKLSLGEKQWMTPTALLIIAFTVIISIVLVAALLKLREYEKRRS